MSKNLEQVEETDHAVTANLGSYFDSCTPTIFDEIVSSNENASVKSHTSKLNFPPDKLSKRIFESDSSFDEPIEYAGINDSHRDAWIPSGNTLKVLRSLATSPVGQEQERGNLTMPGLARLEDFADPVKETAISTMGEEEVSNRNVLTASDVTQDDKGIRHLIKEGCYRAAINLTSRLLTLTGQGYGRSNQPSKHTLHSLQLWFTRLSLLVKIRQTEILEAESVPFGSLDQPDMYYMFYPELYGPRSGSIASFAFRLLIAEIPIYYNKGKKAIDNLYALLAVVKKILKNLNEGLSEEGAAVRFNTGEKEDAIQLWKARKSRILVSIINCSLCTKNYILASEVLEQLIASNEWRKSQSDILKAAIGRIYLSLGDVLAAEKMFSVVKTNKPETNSIKDLIDAGLMAVAQNSFQEALSNFKAASDLDPSNVMLINNVAVCLLYTGKLEASVQLMENMITVKNPVKSLQEAFLLNISTLYELHTTHSRESKLHLLRQLILKYNGDSVNMQCLKLNM